MDAPLTLPARVRLTLCGGVQGVGFRPFIYRLARECELAGWVRNTSHGVIIEAEGSSSSLEHFIPRIARDQPPRSFIQSMETVWISPQKEKGFEIRESLSDGTGGALVQPDIATCPECLKEIFDEHNRRHAYPFTNCTQCGPRFSIVSALPYDRPNTSMNGFVMCGDCRREYDDPSDRRFHAQPNACDQCGPHLEWWNSCGKVLATHSEVIDAAVSAIASGAIVALKGMGGFQLLVDAQNAEAVQRLRDRKQREEKPFALMASSLEEVMLECEVSELEKGLLTSPEAPIVLLKRRGGASRIAREVAPGSPFFGVMLPCTPLHHLLMSRFGGPVVATSGNRSDEPICTDEHDALDRLRGIADYYLVYNRPILRHADDSIVRIMEGRISILRRARGYAPLPVLLQHAAPSVLALGAHMKNTVALSSGKSVFMSQHLGDLASSPSFAAFQEAITDLQSFYSTVPEVIACDLHPDYLSTKAAPDLAVAAGAGIVSVQHHLAHVASCMADNEIQPPVLGVAWDGTGYGRDGTVWGGEFLRVMSDGVERFAHLRCFPLPGGEIAAREPRRSALGLLYAMVGEEAFKLTDLASIRAFSTSEISTLKTMLVRKLNTPLTSSMGRLFDAVASLVEIRQRSAYEGQAAMECEWMSRENPNPEGSYSFAIRAQQNSEALLVDWEPMILGVIADLRLQMSPGEITAKFHHSLADLIIQVAHRSGLPSVVLTGGCFQNETLLGEAVRTLRRDGYVPYWHQRVPANDGGISLGQVVVATKEISNDWKNS